MRAIPLFLRYALFAAAATLTNLATQSVELHMYAGPLRVTAALVVGTGAGLVTKYLLDKHWIFYDSARGLSAHGKRFSLYTLTGVFTTCIFWGMEYAFDSLTPDGRYRFVGAIIGLTIGYVLKYNLDRRFVFMAPPPSFAKAL